MKNFGAKGQRILRIFHLLMASMWLGGALCLNMMLIFLGPGQSGAELLGYDFARKFVDDFLVIPGAIGCLLTGFLISFFTAWGFFKHHWVTVKWILTISCILFGTFFLGPKVNGQPLISAKIGLDALSDSIYLSNRFYNVLGGLLQVSCILFMTIISVLKPWKRK